MSEKTTNTGSPAGALPKPGQGVPRPPQAPPAEPVTMGGLLGEMVWLLTQSPAHRYLFLGDLEWLVMAPMLRSQYRVFHSPEGRVLGVALWAHVSAEVDARLSAGVQRLAPDDWASGEILWLVEMIAPFGGAEGLFSELLQTVFKGKTVKFHSIDAQGKRVVRKIDPNK